MLLSAPAAAPSGNPRPFRNRALAVGRAILERPDLFMPALCTGIILYTVRGMWGADLVIAGDDLPHLSAEAQVRGILSEGGNPFGPLGLLFGTPLLRFYQPLFYLTSSISTLLTGFHPVAVHNALVILCFSLSPWSTVWGFRKIGLSRWAAGIAGFLVMTSVAGFGNSFEAYYRDGIVTQGLGGFIFPLFLGAFASMLRGQGSGLRAGILFALGFLAHAPLAIFAVFTGGVMFFTRTWPLKRIWKQIVIFVVLAGTLPAFWVIPFIHYTERYRPIPDSVMRANRVWWFTGVTNEEMNELVSTGRLFDDGKTALRDKIRHPSDKLIDKLNMASTRYVRPPFLSVIIMFSFLYGLFRLRDPLYRMYTSVFALGLLLYLGPDNVPWMNYLPFGDRIMGFRCTYLMELIGYGLAGMTANELGRAFWRWIRAPRWARVTSRLAFTGASIWLIAFIGYHSHKTGNAAMQKLNANALERLLLAAEPARAGFPLRIQESYPTQARRRWSMLSHRGQAGICGHFWGLGPEATFYLCGNLHVVEKRYPLSRRSGIGYQLSAQRRTRQLEGARLVGTRRSEKLFDKVNELHGHTLWKDRDARFLQVIQRSVLVVAQPEQWMNTVRNWIRNHRSTGLEPPAIVLWRPELENDGLDLAAFERILIMDPDQLHDGLTSRLPDFVAGGGDIWSVVEIDGVETKRLDMTAPPIPELLPKKPTTNVFVSDEVMENKWIRGPFQAKVEMPEAGFILLPEIHNPGWRATVDGQDTPVFAGAADMVVVPVSAGAHTVRFEWSMAPFERYTAWLSGFFWALALLFGTFKLGRSLVQWVRNRRQPAAA